MLNITVIGLYMIYSSLTGSATLPINTPQTIPKIETVESIEKSKGKVADSFNTEAYVRGQFSDIPILVQIARCESTFRHFDKNNEVLRGVENNADVGLMQINEKYHLKQSQKLGLDIYTIDGNMAYARQLYKKEGAKPWMSSSACWSKFTNKDVALGNS
ncbi:MAG: hypothetical protein HQ402_01850 [Parcubacteria group bacterium]|nr:hypothetical protein [Parcubacteria group bacterium]